MLLVVLILVKIWARNLGLKIVCQNFFPSILAVYELLDDLMMIFIIYVIRPFYPYIICEFWLRFGHNRILERMNAKNTKNLNFLEIFACRSCFLGSVSNFLFPALASESCGDTALSYTTAFWSLDALLQLCHSELFNPLILK